MDGKNGWRTGGTGSPGDQQKKPWWQTMWNRFWQYLKDQQGPAI